MDDSNRGSSDSKPTSSPKPPVAMLTANSNSFKIKTTHTHSTVFWLWRTNCSELFLVFLVLLCRSVNHLKCHDRFNVTEFIQCFVVESGEGWKRFIFRFLWRHTITPAEGNTSIHFLSSRLRPHSFLLKFLSLIREVLHFCFTHVLSVSSFCRRGGKLYRLLSQQQRKFSSRRDENPHKSSFLSLRYVRIVDVSFVLQLIYFKLKLFQFYFI